MKITFFIHIVQTFSITSDTTYSTPNTNLEDKIIFPMLLADIPMELHIKMKFILEHATLYYNKFMCLFLSQWRRQRFYNFLTWCLLALVIFRII